MTPEKLRAMLIEILGGIAPEADLSTLDPKAVPSEKDHAKGVMSARTFGSAAQRANNQPN